MSVIVFIAAMEEREAILAALPEIKHLDTKIFPWPKFKDSHNENDGFIAAITIPVSVIVCCYTSNGLSCFIWYLRSSFAPLKLLPSSLSKLAIRFMISDFATS